MIEKKQYQREIDLESKIYFLVYRKPLYVGEIVSAIYGDKKDDRNTRPQTESILKNLTKNDYIEKYSPKKDIEKITPFLSEEDKKDKRYLNRSYYYATSKLLIEKIQYELQRITNKNLDLKEIKILTYFFSLEFFRELLGSLLFRTDKDGKKIFLKEYATLITVIQLLSLICTHVNLTLETGKRQTNPKTVPEFKMRIKKVLKHKTKKEKKDSLKAIFNKYNRIIEDALMNSLAPELKEMEETINEDFSICLPLLGTDILEKISSISYLNNMIKCMYIEIAGVTIPSTYCYFNIDFSDNDKKIKNPPWFLSPIIPTLKKLKREIESVSNHSKIKKQ